MNRYTVTIELSVDAESAAEAERKAHAFVFRNDPAPPFDLPRATQHVSAADTEMNKCESVELPWAPKGPGCTALL